MKQKTKLIILIFGAILIGVYLFGMFQSQKQSAYQTTTPLSGDKTLSVISESENTSIDRLTEENVVVAFVKKNGKLPDLYITKHEARKRGWIASESNLCDVLPGRAIGGDRFGNREKKLPAMKGRIWYEADLNYRCGKRNAHRLLYSNDGLLFVSYDHYKTFIKR